MLQTAKTVDGAGQSRSVEEMLKPRRLTPLTGMRDDLLRPRTTIRSSDVVAVALVLAVMALSAAPARAGEAVARRPPRTAVEIGGASIVLVVAQDRIYAFVDRLEDNAPVTDVALSVVLADGSRLEWSRVSGGQFEAPFSHTGHVQDAFTIALVSPDGTGNGAAEIQYDDAPAPAPPTIRSHLRNAAIALAGGPIGALMGGPFLRPSAARRAARAHPAPPAGNNVTAQLRSADASDQAH